MIFDRTAQYQAYNMASQTVPKTRQIVMLYDGVIRFIQQAKEAIAEKRIQDRFNLLVKASDVIVSLQACLDHENGGDIAKILHDYYTSIDSRILSIHRSNSIEMCDRIINELKEMRAAWNQIDGNHTEQLSSATTTSATSLVGENFDTSPASSITSEKQLPGNGSLQVSA